MVDDADNTKKAINESVLEAFKAEWQRTRDIESKATGIVGFIGIVFSLTLTSLVTILSSDKEETIAGFISSIYSRIFILLILGFLILSMVYGIVVLTVKNWMFLEVKPFVKYCNKGKRSCEQIYEIATEQYLEIIKDNEEQNTYIGDLLKTSYYFFIGSIILLFFYIFLLLNLEK